MAFSLYVDNECLSDSCVRVEWNTGELQWEATSGNGNEFYKTLYENNTELKDSQTWSGPEDVYLTTTISDGGGGGSGGNTPSDSSDPMVVNFNYYIGGIKISDEILDVLDPWPEYRTLECYGIRFLKVNPRNSEDTTDTAYNSLQFEYLTDWYGGKWTSTLTNQGLISARVFTCWASPVCVSINGTTYNPDTVFTSPLEFNCTTVKSVEVNLYYESQVFTTQVKTYNPDPKSGDDDIDYTPDSDLWGYVGVTINSWDTPNKYTQLIPHTAVSASSAGTSVVICQALEKAGFKFEKWVDDDTKEEIPVSENTGSNAITKRPSYSSSYTAHFKGIKNKVTLNHGFGIGSDNYYIFGGENFFRNILNTEQAIKVPKKEGVTIIGWGTTEYSFRDEMRNDSSVQEYIKQYIVIDETGRLIPGVAGYTDSKGNWLTGDRTLYAIVELKTYNITYDGLSVEDADDIVYEVTNNPGNPSQYNILSDITFLAPAGNLPIYKSFNGWDPSRIKSGTTGDKTITATWVVDTYKITLEKNNWFANQSVKIKIGDSAFKNNESINNPDTRRGYDGFEGWYTQENLLTKNGTGSLIINTDGKLVASVAGYTDENGNWLRQENTIVYAKWTPIQYSITYYIDNRDGSTEPDVSSTLPSSYTIENEIILPRVFFNVPEGYFFDGWYTNKNYSGYVDSIPRGSTGDKIFYGRYKELTFDIIYKDQGGGEFSGDVSDLPVTHTYGTITELKAPTKSEHVFGGWYTNKECTGTPKTSIGPTEVTTNFSSDFTFYAKWTANLPVTTVTTPLDILDPKRRLATYKWVNNVFCEPEITDEWTVRNEDFFVFDQEKQKPDSLRCIGYNYLNSGFKEQIDPRKQITHYFYTEDVFEEASVTDPYQLSILGIEGNSIRVSTNSPVNKNSDGEFKKVLGTNGFIMYFTMNNEDGTLYKVEIPTQPYDMLIPIPNVSNIADMYVYRIPWYFSNDKFAKTSLNISDPSNLIMKYDKTPIQNVTFN